jgi:hypothetical protein
MEFRKYLQIDWEYHKLNYSLIVDKNLAKPGITLNSIFNLIAYHK